MILDLFNLQLIFPLHRSEAFFACFDRLQLGRDFQAALIDHGKERSPRKFPHQKKKKKETQYLGQDLLNVDIHSLPLKRRPIGDEIRWSNPTPLRSVLRRKEWRLLAAD